MIGDDWGTAAEHFPVTSNDSVGISVSFASRSWSCAELRAVLTRCSDSSDKLKHDIRGSGCASTKGLLITPGTISIRCRAVASGCASLREDRQ